MWEAMEQTKRLYKKMVGILQIVRVQKDSKSRACENSYVIEWQSCYG